MKPTQVSSAHVHLTGHDRANPFMVKSCLASSRLKRPRDQTEGDPGSRHLCTILLVHKQYICNLLIYPVCTASSDSGAFTWRFAFDFLTDRAPYGALRPSKDTRPIPLRTRHGLCTRECAFFFISQRTDLKRAMWLCTFQ